MKARARTEDPGRELDLVDASDGLRVFTTPGLRLPDELHLELDRRGRLGAYWNGQAWIGRSGVAICAKFRADGP